MARAPAIATPRAHELKALQLLADQTRQRLAQLDDLIDQQARLLAQTGAPAIASQLALVTQNLNNLNTRVTALAEAFEQVSTGGTTTVTNYVLIETEIEGEEHYIPI